MSRTAQLDLPLVLPAQAQKHVTVNEALARLDAVAQLRVLSARVAVPPAASVDGTGYIVPAEAAQAWAGKVGQIAVWSNGGWIFLRPKAGWRTWDEDTKGTKVFDGVSWISHAAAVSDGGAAVKCRIVEVDHTIETGQTSMTAPLLPKNAQVIGVTGRVVLDITGPDVTGWRIGVPGSDNRYGSGLGLAMNSFLLGLTGSPVTYYEDTRLLLSAEGGSFAAGRVRLAAHIIELTPPRPV